MADSTIERESGVVYSSTICRQLRASYRSLVNVMQKAKNSPAEIAQTLMKKPSILSTAFGSYFDPYIAIRKTTIDEPSNKYLLRVIRRTLDLPKVSEKHCIIQAQADQARSIYRYPRCAALATRCVRDA